MGKVCELGLKKQIDELALEGDELWLVIKHMEVEIRNKYKGRMPTSRYRIRKYIVGHITQMRSRDPLFEQYGNLCNQLDNVIKTAKRYMHGIDAASLGNPAEELAN